MKFRFPGIADGAPSTFGPVGGYKNPRNEAVFRSYERSAFLAVIVETSSGWPITIGRSLGKASSEFP
jgi:hypothetical protein